MHAMPGTMGMDPATFTGMWTLMMAAMMLPSVTPFVGVYERTISQDRGARLTGLTVGYLAVWGASGIVAYAIAEAFGALAASNTTWARVVAVVAFAGAGLYQLSPLKMRCLSHCRTPLGHLIHYLGYQGSMRDIRAGMSHGWFCLGCCWALMVLMVAFGVMNMPAMIALAGVIGIEKLWKYGESFARAVGITALIFAVALVFFPGIAAGLYPGSMMTMD
jgi:predicted metal-binding membrane protein